MSLHRASGQARVVLSGTTHYLGKWGNDSCRVRYDELVRSWLARDRARLPASLVVASVAELGDRYTEFSAAYYVKAGRPTKQLALVKDVLKLLYRSGHGEHGPSEFAPRHLKSFRDYLLSDESKVMPDGTHASRWSRTTINGMVAVVVRMFGWALSEELISADVVAMLQAVPPLRRGRVTRANTRSPREPVPVAEIPDADIEAVRKALTPHLAAMIEVQRRSAMRPTELLHMRGRDLQIAPGLIKYTVRSDGNKNDHRAHERVVYLGPRAIAALTPYLLTEPEAFIWSPRRSEQERHTALAATRKSRRYPGRDSTEARRAARAQTAMKYAARYSADSYKRLIERVCVRIGVKVWRPNQLRHTGATEIVELIDDPSVVQEMLGHRHISTTMIYIARRRKRASEAAAKHG